MTIRDGVDALNKCIPDDIDAIVILLVGLQRKLMTPEELERLDFLRGEKLNLVHENSWHPEQITREDAELIRRGLDVYRDVLWQLNESEILGELERAFEKEGKENE